MLAVLYAVAIEIAVVQKLYWLPNEGKLWGPSGSDDSVDNGDANIGVIGYILTAYG